MSKHNNGGPAFPSTDERAHTINRHIPGLYYSTTRDHHPGMSLRDYFAARAMQGEIASSVNHSSRIEPTSLSKWAYRVADAMLAARQEGQS